MRRPWVALALVWALLAPATLGAAEPPAPHARLAGLLAEATDAELARTQAALAAAAAALAAVQAGPAPPGLGLTDRLLRDVAAQLNQPVIALDPGLAVLVDSRVAPGLALPASPLAVLAADAMDGRRSVIGVAPGGAGEAAPLVIGLAQPVLTTGAGGGQILGVLAAALRPATLAVALGRAEAARAPEGAVARLVRLDPGDVTEPALRAAAATPLLRLGPAADAADWPESWPIALRRLHLAPSLAILVAGPPEPAPPVAAPPMPGTPALWHGLPAHLGLEFPTVTGLFALTALLLFSLGLLRRRGAPAAASELEARRSLSELRAMSDGVPIGLALCDRQGRLLHANARMTAWAGLGGDFLIGRRVQDALPPPLAEAIESALAQVLREGRAVADIAVGLDTPGLLRHARTLSLSCHPVRDRAGGAVEAVSLSLIDVTEHARAEQSRSLLVREMTHRMKNCLSTVQTIAQQTLRHAGGDASGFVRSFGERLGALARGHDLLTAQSWGEAELTAVLRAALAPWLADVRLTLEPGPEVMLRPSQAQALVLGLHELATNAAKHGALTRAEGQVRLGWRLDGEGHVLLAWAEAGGPPVPPTPPRQGFGTRLLDRALSQDLGTGATADILFDPTGLRARIRFRPASLPETRLVPAREVA